MKRPMTDIPLIKLLLERRRLVFGYIFALTRDVDAAEEVFQNLSLAVLDEASRGTVVERFLPWACSVARNRVSDYYRKRGRAEPVSLLLANTVAEAVVQNEENREDAARRIRGLLDCIESLPARQRQLVELHYRDQKAIPQVAIGVGWKANAVKVALSKIRRTLLECLRGKNLIEGPEYS